MDVCSKSFISFDNTNVLTAQAMEEGSHAQRLLSSTPMVCAIQLSLLIATYWNALTQVQQLIVSPNKQQSEKTVELNSF